VSDRNTVIEHKASLPDGMTRDELVEFLAELDATPGGPGAVLTARVSFRGRIRSVKAEISQAPPQATWEDRVRAAGLDPGIPGISKGMAE